MSEGDQSCFFEPITPKECPAALVVGDHRRTMEDRVAEKVRYLRATGWTTGPWSQGLQHGGPLCALVCWAAEQKLNDTPNSASWDVVQPFHAVRVSGSFHGAVPVGPLRVATRVHRQGKATAVARVDVQAVQGSGVHGSRRTYFSARVLALRGAPKGSAPKPDDITSAVADNKVECPKPADESLPVDFATARDGAKVAEAAPGVGYVHAHDNRVAKGIVEGPTAVWFRTKVHLMPDVPLTGLGRVLAAADSTNGISGLVPMSKFFYGAIDVNVAVFRPPQGEWICLDARTDMSPDGTALATARVFDREGYLGVVSQVVLVARINKKAQL